MLKYFTAILISTVSFCHPALANEKIILPIATEHYPPYEMLEPIAGLKGFDYEVMAEIFSQLGFELNVGFYPWKRALAYTKQGKVLGILTCAFREERNAYMMFSDPISVRTTGFYIRKGFKGPKPLTIEEVKGQRVASVEAYASISALMEAGIAPTTAHDTQSAIKMLRRNRFDYLYLNKQSTDFIINQLGLSSAFEFYAINHKEFYFCFSKKYPGAQKIKQQFNNSLRTLKNNGTYQKIHNKYR